MLAAIGAETIEELFAAIPEAYRLKKPLDLPGPMSETEVIRYFQERAGENSSGYTSFLGAGVYSHLRSVVTDTILQRGEFLTSYTPYQAEISQGTLQAIFEFQTLMCQLTGQEVANASMYDGSTAMTEAVLMAERLTNRQRVLVARSVHPEYREVLRTYAKNSGLHVEEVPYAAGAGTVDVSGLEAEIRDDVCAVVVQSPNFFGGLETLAPLAEVAHAKGSLLVVAVTEAVSLGLVKPPVEADIVAMEGQSIGLAPSYGGPYVGVIASREKYVRQMPGRLAGQTTDLPSWICVDAGHTRAAHPARESDIEYLHESGAVRVGGDRTPVTVGQRRLARTRGTESCEGAFHTEGVGENSGREAELQRAILQRVCRRVAAVGEDGECGIAEIEDHWPICPGNALSGTEQACAGMCDGDDYARGH
jgi:hypothetical protein